jgi:NitT/TauT family transport system ATP-binding protein
MMDVTMTTELISFENVVKSYDETDVLGGVDFQIFKGDIIGILGPSGVGKSTLLKIIAGIVDVSSGHVTNRAERIGYVFQEPRLLPWKSARDNIALGLMARNLSKKEARKRADKMLSDMGLAGFGKYFPGELSGGMVQRVALARAFAIEPDILLLDEPFSALDAGFKEVMINILEDLIGEHRTTVLYVSHAPEEVVRIANKIFLIFAGGVLEELPVAEDENFKQFLQDVFIM